MVSDGDRDAFGWVDDGVVEVVGGMSLGVIYCSHLTGMGGNFLHDVLCTWHMPLSHMWLGESYEHDLVIGYDESSKWV